MWGGRREIVWLLKKLCSIVWVRLRYVGVAAHFTALCDVAVLNMPHSMVKVASHCQIAFFHGYKLFWEETDPRIMVDNHDPEFSLSLLTFSGQ